MLRTSLLTSSPRSSLALQIRVCGVGKPAQMQITTHRTPHRQLAEIARLRNLKNTRLLSTSPTSPAENEKPRAPLQTEPKSVSNAPGLALAAGVSGLGFASASVLGSALSIPLSGIPLSILIGLGVNNAISLPQSVRPGLKVATTTILRIGIVCVGAKLSLYDMVALGAGGVPVVLMAMGAGFAYIPWAADKAGLSPKMGTLLAAGTSVCGVTAITAASPVIGAENRDTAVAVANVVAFGTMGMLAYPYMVNSMVGTSAGVGLFLGTGIHDTSQVLGAAATHNQMFLDDAALKAAAVTKLTRNLFLGAVIPGLAYQYRAETPTSSETQKTVSGLATFQKYVPGFVVGFIGMGALRTLGDATLLNGAAYGFLDGDQFGALIKAVGGQGSTMALGCAMAGVGLSTSASALKGVGIKPFLVGGSGALVVGGTALGMITALEWFGFVL